VPLHDERGDVIASVNLAVNASRWSLERIHAELLPRLLETAAEIERDLRAIGMPVPEPLVSV
jgi:IclR family pca regulon transcriptional regulator